MPERRGTHVKDDERGEDADVAPVMRVEDVEAELEERVRRRERAVLARRARGRVREVPAGGRDVRAHVLGARLPRGRRDLDELDGRTLDGLLADRLAEERLDEVGVRREAVHPLPPSELAEGLQDTVAVQM